MEEGSPPQNAVTIHRVQKADTTGGLSTIKSLSARGAPYAMLLYERFLGRPFPVGEQKYRVIACIAGRGFRVRAEDMKKMLIAPRGKVFTLKTLGSLVDYYNSVRFRTKQP